MIKSDQGDCGTLASNSTEGEPLVLTDLERAIILDARNRDGIIRLVITDTKTDINGKETETLDAVFYGEDGVVENAHRNVNSAIKITSMDLSYKESPIVTLASDDFANRIKSPVKYKEVASATHQEMDELSGQEVSSLLLHGHDVISNHIINKPSFFNSDKMFRCKIGYK